DRNRSHWSTSKTPSYTKSVSWQHHLTPVNINGTVWFQGDGCKANTCGWDFIVTLYNPKTHEVVGYRYFGLDDPAYLVWFGEIGVHEFAYLVKNYVAAVN
ncbi:hypothetical protein, partial [Escherichia coli]|uniref:hypothetical protein n=1 Tax=Escherichia coli TaxID=562 RepID=UPI00203373D1